MIITVSLAELLVAMNIQIDEFQLILPAMQKLGFPLLSENGEFEIANLLEWVVRQQDFNLAVTTMLAQKLTDGQ
jgi:hypothetical protein